MTKIKVANIILIAFILVTMLLPIGAAQFGGKLECKSAVLMEASTGRILYEKNANTSMPPASVTKIMTLLLVAEAVDSGKINLTDMVCVSEHAASMGGSQVYLKVGEEMSVEEMIKCVVIASANDCAAALAEHLYGSEDAFVAAMNARAKELGMNNTNFENTNGLDDTTTNHVTSAMDIAIMSRELLKHELILKYSSTWMDTIRDGTFGLTNTNRLVRFYPGANGLKTGSTAKAQFCISATAKRNGMQLIAVIMAAPTRDIRNNEAKSLLDFGFSNYDVYSAPQTNVGAVKVKGGKKDFCNAEHGEFSVVLEKGKVSRIEQRTELPESLYGGVEKGSVIGKMIFECDGEEIGFADIYTTEKIEKITFGDIFRRVARGLCLN